MYDGIDRRIGSGDGQSMNMPTDDELVARIREAERASAFFQDSYDTFRLQFPNQHIALREGKVVAVGDDSWDLVNTIEAAGMLLSDVWTFFVPAEPMRLLL
jgi:hypothetical protein